MVFLKDYSMIFSDFISSTLQTEHCETIRWRFDNKYGASLVYNTITRKPELAVLRDDKLCYDTDITSDIVINLDLSQLVILLSKIKSF